MKDCTYTCGKTDTDTHTHTHRMQRNGHTNTHRFTQGLLPSVVQIIGVDNIWIHIKWPEFSRNGVQRKGEDERIVILCTFISRLPTNLQTQLQAYKVSDGDTVLLCCVLRQENVSTCCSGLFQVQDGTGSGSI